jgi:hypothetical protein
MSGVDEIDKPVTSIYSVLELEMEYVIEHASLHVKIGRELTVVDD